MIDDVTRIELYIAMLSAMQTASEGTLCIKIGELITLAEHAKDLVKEIEELI